MRNGSALLVCLVWLLCQVMVACAQPAPASKSLLGVRPAGPSPASPPLSHKPPAPARQAEVLPVPPLPPASPPPAPAKPAEAAASEKLPDPEKSENAPAKLPRFASLRSDDVNMRAGPGARYRIEWVYKRRDLPVEIEREFDVWRYVRDADGIEGWMQQATLTGRRSFIVRGQKATMRAEPKDGAEAVAILEPGVIGRIRSCDATSAWCNVQTGSYRGYLKRDQFWGTLPNEAIGP